MPDPELTPNMDKAAAIIEKLSTDDRKRSGQSSGETLTRLIVEAAKSKKAIDIVVMDMREISELANFFVVCSGESDVQIKAIVETIEVDVKASANERPWRTEGSDHRQWVIIDYVDVVVHVFAPERRLFYNLERLWGDAKIVPQTDETENNIEISK